MINRFELCDHYFRKWLPEHLDESESKLLLSIGKPVKIELYENKESQAWILLQTELGLEVVCDVTPVCEISMSVETFLQSTNGKLTPRFAFFTGKIIISGDKFLALKMGNLLQNIFKRIPWNGEDEDSPKIVASECQQSIALTQMQKDILALHFDSQQGSEWWIQRSAELGIEAKDIKTLSDLRHLGLMDRDAMARASWRDFVPKSVLNSSENFILGESGGTTGDPVTLAWTSSDFEAAFITPLLSRLRSEQSTQFQQWLFVGPTGPHIIGKAADALAKSTANCDALKVDFDPRWHRKMLQGSPASIRHLDHVIQQSIRLLKKEFVDALFITPSILKILFEQHRGDWIRNLKLVHLGGQSIDDSNYQQFLSMLPKDCLLINGYGNSLFGCVIENSDSPLMYQVTQDRLYIEFLESDHIDSRRVGAGETGRILFHRFDRSALLLNVMERDEVTVHRDQIFHQPQPVREMTHVASGGIY